MKHKLSTIWVFLVVLAVAVLGLGACSRSAAEREAPEATSMATPVSSSPESSPAPGETVVSAVTPVAQTPGAEAQLTPGTEVQPTSGTEEQPTAAPTAEPSVVAQPSPAATTAPAATAAPLPPSAQTGAIWHTVQTGETLSSIGRRYGTTWQAIARANGIVNPNQIYVGQKLKIPTSASSSTGSTTGTSGCRVRHTVKRGEWVWQIARNYGVSPYDILAANGLTIQTANTIYAGTVLCIP